MQNPGSYGCLGLGSCKKACAFGAIEIVDGVAVIDKDKCVACGKCVSTCPKHIIELLPAKKKVKVQCSSKDMGKNVIPESAPLVVSLVRFAKRTVLSTLFM